MEENGWYRERVEEEALRQAHLAELKLCEHCASSKVLLRRIISGSGVSMFFWLCAECDGHARRKNLWISHKVIDLWLKQERLKDRGGVPLKAPEGIPIFKDHSKVTLCIVCQEPGAEYHHWAPQSMAHIFGDDWHKWPGDYLCKEHHDLWHVVVTPQLVKGGNGQKVKAGVAS